MATNLVVRTDVSGTSFVLDVTALELSPSLSTLDFEVTHNGLASLSYAKTSPTQLTYTGTSVVLGTRVVARRLSSITQAETTFISTTTASALTNALDKLRLRVDELDARLGYTLNQLQAGGISLGTIPISSVAFGASWNGDNVNAPSRGAVYTKNTSQDTAIAAKADTASPALTGVPTAPTAATSANTTQIATTAFVKSLLPTAVVTGGQNSYTNVASGMIIKSGSVVATATTGVAPILFSAAFPSVCLAVIACNGDSASVNTRVEVQAGFTASGFSATRADGASGGVRVNFIAIGF